MKKVLTRGVIFLFFLMLLPLPVHAAESDAAAEWRDFVSAVPDEVTALLPDSFSDSSLDDAKTAAWTEWGADELLRAVGKVCGAGVESALSLFAQICGVLLLSAVLRALSPDDGDGAGRALSFCSTLALTGVILSLQWERFALLSRYFEMIKGIAAAFLPLMGTLYAMGGNVRVATVNHGILSAFLSLLETLCSGTVLPIAGMCIVLAVTDAVTAGGTSLRGLAALLKRSYTLALSFVMLLLCGVLGLQTTLAKAGDTLALRTARFAAGSFLPVVGGSVSESLRTVAGSVEYLRSVAGSGAILVLFLAFLPTFVSVLLTRCAFLLGSGAAKLLRCESEEKVLSEMGSVFGYFLAIIASLFVMLVFSLTIFTQCAAAGR